MLKSLIYYFKQAKDMTNGHLFGKIIAFAIPTMFTTFVQLLYVTVDLSTVHFGDSAESMGAIASNTALINLIIVVFTGVSIGANVLLSEARGAGNKEKANKVVHTSLIFALISGIFVGIVGFIVSDNILQMMGTGEHYFAKAALYLKIYFAGVPFVLLYNYSAQLLIGQGDSKSPFISLLIAGLLNVAFDVWFVFGFKMGVAGVAIATVIAEAVSAFVCLFVLMKSKKNYVNLSLKDLKVDGIVLKEVLKVGLPAGLQGFFFSLPNVLIQSSLYQIDPGNVNLENGVIAAGNIESYFYAVCDAICISTMTFIAANMGAKKIENIKKVITYGLFWGAIMCAILAAIVFFFHRPLLSLFVEELEAIEAGYTRLSLTGYLYFLDFTMLFTGSVLRGLKRSTYPMITALVCCTGLRIILVLTLFPFPMFHTVFWLYALFPFTWIVATICNTVALLTVLPKDLQKIKLTRVEAL